MHVNEVAAYLKRAEHVTIILGAGASISAGIPSAGKLVEQVNAAYGHCLGGLSEDDRKDYGKAMGALSPGERKALIQPLMDNARINWGHIALACLIRNSAVKRILTFNFDLILERTASLMGLHLPVYDFGVAPTREIGGLASPAIFHLHGQSFGLRLMNSEAETAAHAEQLRPLLADSLRNHLVIVAGYSGAADGAFKVIEEEFNSQFNLIWLGHGKEPDAHLRPLLERDYATYVGGCDFDRTMIDLARDLGCFPPKVIDNPPAHVLDELEEVVDFPVGDDGELDILTDARTRLQQAAEGWREAGSGEGDAVRDLLSGADGSDAGGDEADPAKPMSAAVQRVRAWAVVNQGLKLQKASEDLTGAARREKLAAAQAKYAEALRIKPDMHEALHNWGVALGEEAKDLTGAARREKLADAQAKFAEALRIKPDKHEALNNWASALLEEAHGLTGVERSQKLAEARDKASQAKKFEGKANYNLACVHALQGDIDAALDELEACKADGTLPDRAHLDADPDMEPLRGAARFRALLDGP